MDSSRQVTIVFPGHVPSKKNSKRIIPMGKHHKVIPSEAHDRWYSEAIKIVEGIPKFDSPYHLELKFYPGDLVRWDMDGSHTSIQDLLVDTEVVPDDNWRNLKSYSAKVAGFSKENPRVEVTIHQLEFGTFDNAIWLLANPAEISALAKESKAKVRVKDLKADILKILEETEP